MKQRDSSRDEGYHSSKLRDKSRSPTRGATSNSDLNEVLFSGSSGVSTPLSQGGRRSSLTFSPKRNVVEVQTSTTSTAASDHESSSKKASFVTKTTVFLDQNASSSNNITTTSASGGISYGGGHTSGGAESSSVERVKFDSSSLPTSPTSEDGPASLSSSGAGGGGILKRKGSMGSRQPPRSSQDSETGNGSNSGGSGVTRKRSILKYDSFEVADDSPNNVNSGERDQEQPRPRRGVLKKDSSYDDTLRPILKYPLTSSGEGGASSIENFRENDFTKNNTVVLNKNTSNNADESMSSTTSSEDLENLIDQSNRGFVNVNIDPLPKSVEDSNSEFSETETEMQIHRNIPSPRKSSLHGPRLPVIPPSSVNITSDGNLACKLEALTGQAEAKIKQLAEDEAKESISNALAIEKK